jgi:hypothetical protein
LREQRNEEKKNENINSGLDAAGLVTNRYGPLTPKKTIQTGLENSVRTLCGGRQAGVIGAGARGLPPKQHVVQDDSQATNVHRRRVGIGALVVQLASHFRGDEQLGFAKGC